MSVISASGRVIKTGSQRLSAFVSRSERRVGNTLGIISGDDANKVKKVRDEKLDIYDKYLDSTQYDNLIAWDSCLDADEHVPVRKRKPRIIYNFAKILANRVSSKLVGNNVFPQFKVEDDPDTDEFFRSVLKASHLQHRIIDPMKRMMVSGSVFVRFFLVGGALKVEHYNAKHCYPEFLPNGELKSIKIQYVYKDSADKDVNGKPKEKWYKLDLGPITDTLYDNPEYKPNVEPIFNEVEIVQHGFGFVQGEWFRTSVLSNSIDGYSLISDILGFIDELNYSLSQSSQAVSYNQDPQLTLKVWMRKK